MSMAPDPGKILDLLSLLDEDLQARTSFDSLLKRAVSQLPQLWPSIVLARAYRPEAGGLRLVAATDESQAKTLESADLFAKALAERRVIHNAKHGLWGLPLADQTQVFGLLVLRLNEDTSDAEAWLKLLAAMLVQVIGRQNAESANETQQLYELNRQMLGAQDTLEVLRALRTLTQDSVSIIHNTYIYNAQQQLVDAVLHHIVTPTAEQVIEQSVLADFGPEAIEHLRPLLPTWDDVILIEQTTNAPANAPAMFMETLRQQNIHSAVFIPIWQQGRVSDLVLIGFPQPRQFDERAQRLFRAMRDQMTIVLQVQRALQEAQHSAAALGRQVSVLQTLNDLSTVISMARDEAQLLNQSGQALVTALSIDYAQLYMFDPGQQTGTIVSEYPHRGNTGRRLRADEVPVTNPPDTRNPAPVVVNDLADARVTEQGRTLLKADNIRAFMLLPLFVRGQVVGGIRLDIRRENRLFTSEMAEIAQTILAQVVVGLQNIRLPAESQRRSEQLQRVNQFSQTLQSTLDMSVILETALNEIHQIIPVERMTIALLDPAVNALRTVALYANSENYLTLTNGVPVQLQGSLVGRAWENGRLLHIPDIVQETGVAADDVRELRALLVTPLAGRSAALGIISVGHSQAHIYGETDIIVFQQMIGLLSAAIENASTFARSQRQARNEALVNDIATQLQHQVELDDMLQIAANDLGRALGARRARIRLGTRVTE
jgi:GAF domain-containing protein